MHGFRAGGIAAARETIAPVPLLSNNDDLAVGDTFAFPLSQIAKTRRVSVTLDSQKAVNCLEDDTLVLPAHTQVCVDSTNAKKASCDVFAAPVGESTSCAITTTGRKDHVPPHPGLRNPSRRPETPLAPTCVTGTNVLKTAATNAGRAVETLPDVTVGRPGA